MIHNDHICGFDYNKPLSVIASISNDKSIQLWNGNDGSLIINYKQTAHNNYSFILTN